MIAFGSLLADNEYEEYTDEAETQIRAEDIE